MNISRQMMVLSSCMYSTRHPQLHELYWNIFSRFLSTFSRGKVPGATFKTSPRSLAVQESISVCLSPQKRWSLRLSWRRAVSLHLETEPKLHNVPTISFNYRWIRFRYEMKKHLRYGWRANFIGLGDLTRTRKYATALVYPAVRRVWGRPHGFRAL
jgi:hypothetical protein